MLSRKRWARHWKNKSVLVRSDNVSVVKYINRQGGGDNFTPSVSICSEVMADGHRESDSIEGSSYSGRSQCLSRPFKTIDRESRSVAQRMVSEGNSSTEDLASVLSTSNRSVCISTEPQTASLLLLA